ncbi:hypothetical protein [Ferrimonas senticii]|uniref:hypothetical protein n=1 Tax=Ferrimonas senticii TaxID=394566 RepID=UPI000419DAE3|nr:hypothetical protein [Ferrimonas senticii]
MSLQILLILVALLLLVIIGFNLFQQYRWKVEHQRRQEIGKHKAAVSELERLLSFGAFLPLTNRMVQLLNQRIIANLKQIIAIDPSRSDVLTQLRNMQHQLAQTPPQERTIDSFSSPSAEGQVIAIIKVLKRLKDFARIEQSRGTLAHDDYVTECQRVEQLLLRINVTVQFDRARVAASKNQIGSARQHLNQLHKLLINHSSDDSYSQLILAKASAMQDELTNRAMRQLPPQAASAAGADEDDCELDQLFSPKRKW